MTLQSAIYEGEVLHRRHTPARHAFRYRLFLAYLDLEELPSLFAGRWLWSANRPAVAWLRRRDHLGDPLFPLNVAVRDLVQEQLGFRPDGPIRLLTHLRYFGFAMNPVSFYYCFDQQDSLECVVAEVNNTPWGEQHCYALDLRSACESKVTLRAQNAKAFHVSPFLSMDFVYRWRITVPDQDVQIDIANHRLNAPSAPPDFNASLRLERREWTTATLTRVLIQYPIITLQVYLAIYWQALRLWLKGIPYVPHPPSPSNHAATHSSEAVDSSSAQSSSTASTESYHSHVNA